MALLLQAIKDNQRAPPHHTATSAEGSYPTPAPTPSKPKRGSHREAEVIELQVSWVFSSLNA